jgi:thymidylate synthase ThyX
MLTELRKVIPSFLRRVDQAERGVQWSTYLAERRAATREVAERLLGAPGPPEPVAGVALTDFDPDAEVKVVAAALYSVSHLGDAALLERARAMTVAERAEVLRAYVGERVNRRHKPGRAFERASYRFDVLSDYGAFRDLQRHRMLTIEWQPLTPDHGYVRPDAVDAAGCAAAYDAAIERSAQLHDALKPDFPEQAPYALSMAYRVRYVMQFNAREAMHLLELRTNGQGHPSYRRVGQEMHRLIAEQAGHRALAAAMAHVDHSAVGADLERLQAERRADARRRERAGATPP